MSYPLLETLSPLSSPLAAPILYLFLPTLSLLYYFGAFGTVKAHLTSYPGAVVACRSYCGPYRNVPVVLESVRKSLKQQRLKFGAPVTIYLDDPEQVPELQCRSLVGYILPEATAADADLYTQSLLDMAHDDVSAEYSAIVSQASNIQLVQVPTDTHTISSKFPLVPWAKSFSVILGVLRVYPELRRLLEVHRDMKATKSIAPVMEVYNARQGEIEYVLWTNENAVQQVAAF